MEATRLADSVGDIEHLSRSWRRHLRAENKSSSPIKSYLGAAAELATYLSTAGMPTAVSEINREHVESFIEAVLDRTSAATAATRFRGLQQLFRWLVDEGEIPSSPMQRMPKSSPTRRGTSARDCLGGA